MIGAALIALLSLSPASADPLDLARQSLRHEIDRATAPGSVIVLDITDAGHWVLQNGPGERFTAASPDELRRGFAALGRSPDASGTFGSIFTTPRAALLHWKQLRQVRASRLVMVDQGTFPLTLRPDRPPLMQSALGPLDVDDIETLRAVHWHAIRPLGLVRVLAIEPGGPTSLTSAPTLEAASNDRLVDAIDPTALISALTALRGQIAVVTGQVDGPSLRIRGSRGVDAMIDLAQLRAAALGADVSLIVRHGTGPAQPFTPAYRLLRRDPSGPPQSVNELIRAELHASTALARRRDDGTLEVTITPAPASLLDTAYWQKLAANLYKPLFGETPVERLTLWLPSQARQTEVDRRLIKSIPSLVQFAYPLLLLLGLVGLPVARRWFTRLWPPETPADYANATGFHAARALRSLVFALLVLPLAAIAAAPANLIRLATRRPA